MPFCFSLRHLSSPFAFPESDELLELTPIIPRVIPPEDTIPLLVLRDTLPFRQLLNRLPNLDIMTSRKLRHTFHLLFQSTFCFNDSIIVHGDWLIALQIPERLRLGLIMRDATADELQVSPILPFRPDDPARPRFHQALHQ